VTGLDQARTLIQAEVVGATKIVGELQFSLPNVRQNIIYIWSAATGTTRTGYVFVANYIMPNGAG